MSLVGYQASNHPQQIDARGASEEVDDRGTHPSTFDPLNRRFGFTLDVAAAPHNAKCGRYFTRTDDGLIQSWAGETVWCNPPYSAIGRWVEKAWAEHEQARGIVMLLPANRTEQAWWMDLVEPHRDRVGSPLHVEFIRGRIRFIKAGQTKVGPNERPPFGCCLLIWNEFPVWSANWQGPECEMCRGTGVYPYKPAAGITWAVCAACNGHGKEPSEPRDEKET